MSDAEHIKAKLAGLQIHLAYLEGWLSTHKGAIQEFKMRTLYDIVTGKKKAGLETISKCEHVLNMLQVKMIKVEKPDATPTVSKQPVADGRSTAATSEPLRSTGTVDRIETDRGPRGSSRDRSSSERSAPSHRRCSRWRTHRDDRSTERTVVYDVDAPSRSNSRERNRNRSTSRERDRRRRHSPIRPRSSSRERYRCLSPERTKQYTASETRRRSPSRERYRRSTPDQHGARSDSRDHRSAAADATRSDSRDRRSAAAADAKSVFKRLGDKIAPKQYENLNIALRKDTKHIASAGVGASVRNMDRISTAGPSRPDTETLSAAEMAEMRADNAARFGSDIAETSMTNKALSTMAEGSSSSNLDALLRKRKQLTKELIGLNEIKQVVESAPATPTSQAAAEQSQPQVTSPPMSAQPESARVPRPTQDFNLACNVLPAASAAVVPSTESQSLVSLVQQALAIETSRLYQNNEPRPLSPTAMLAVQHVLSRPTPTAPQRPEPPLSPTAMLAVQLVMSNPNPLPPTPVEVPLPALDTGMTNPYPNFHAQRIANSFAPDHQQPHYEPPQHRDPRVHSTANHYVGAPFSSDTFEVPFVSLPPQVPQTYAEHRRAKAAELQSSSSNHRDQPHLQNQHHHNNHQQHQRNTSARVEPKKTPQQSQQPQQPNRGSTSSNKVTASDSRNAAGANTKQNTENNIAALPQFVDVYRGSDYSKTVDIISSKNASIMQNFKIPKKRTKSTTEQLTAEPTETDEQTALPTADVLPPAARPNRFDQLTKRLHDASRKSSPTKVSSSSSSKKKAAIQRRRRSTCCAPATGSDEVTSSAAAAAVDTETTQTPAAPLAPSSTTVPAEKGALLELIQSLDTEEVQKIFNLLELRKTDGLKVVNSRAADAVAVEALPDDISVPTMDDDDIDVAAAADDDAAADGSAADAAADDVVADDVAADNASPVVGRPKVVRKPKRLNELQKLNEDIRTMFISEGVLTATGRRNCTMSKPAPEPITKRSKRMQSKAPASAEPMDDGDELVTLTVAKKPDEDPRTLPKLRITRRRTICLSHEEAQEMLGRCDSVETSSLPQLSNTSTRKRTTTPLDTADTDAATHLSATKRPHIDNTSPAYLQKLQQQHGIRVVTVALLRQTVDQMLAADEPASPMATSTAIAVTAPLDAIILKNTNKQMYINNPDMRSDCLLCDQRSRALVIHYANDHPTAENYVSRLPPAIAGKLHTAAGRRQLDQAKRDPIRFKIQQMCVFCLDVRQMFYTEWLCHLATHTGELNYQCRNCLRLSAWPTHTCNGKKHRLKRLPAPHFAGDRIELHVCKLCNYAQFGRERIVRHLVNQHGIEQRAAEDGKRITAIDCMRLPKRTKSKAAKNGGKRGLQVRVKVEKKAMKEEMEDNEEDTDVDVDGPNVAAVASVNPTTAGNASDTASDHSVGLRRNHGRRTRQSMRIMSDEDNDEQQHTTIDHTTTTNTDTDTSVGQLASERTRFTSIADRLSERFKSADQPQQPPTTSRSRRQLRRSITPTMDENQSTDTTSEPSENSIVFKVPAGFSSSPSPSVRSQTASTPPQRRCNVEQPELIIKSSPSAGADADLLDDDDDWEDCSDSEPMGRTVAKIDDPNEVDASAITVTQTAAGPTPVAPPQAMDSLALLCHEIISDDSALPTTADAPMPTPPSPAIIVESTKNTVINDIVKRLSHSISFVRSSSSPANTDASATTDAVASPPPEPSLNPDGTKTINRIDNIGYSVFKNRVAFCCLVDGCGFESAVMYQMSSHLKEHKSGWSGYCYMCEKQIHKHLSYSLNIELQHMRSAHILIDSSKLVLSPRPQPTSSPTSTTADAPAPMFVISCVTGGIATSPPASTIHISSPTGSKTIVPLTPPKRSPPTSSVQIGSVVQLANSPNRSFPKPTAAGRNVLKPWTTSYSCKMPDISALMLHQFSLYSLHKCMARSCSFASGNDDLALAHWRSHDNAAQLSSTVAASVAGCVATWLECAYCDLVAGSAEQLVQHTLAEHRSSIFLCPHCFYRSCAAYNVLQHQLAMHRDVTADTAQVMVAPGKPKALSAELLQVHRSRALNVPQLHCVAGCRKRFYTLRAYEQHMFIHTKAGNRSHHCDHCAAIVPVAEMLRHLMEQHQIGRYACVYCVFGTNSVVDLREHMWRQHPSKLLYATCRLRRDDLTNIRSVPQPSDDPLDATVLVYIGQKVNNQLFQRCPYTESQLCFVLPAQAATLGIEAPARISSTETQLQLAITAVNSISKESFNATSVSLLLNDVNKHTISMDQILNLDEVEKYFIERRPANIGMMTTQNRSVLSTAASAIVVPAPSSTSTATATATATSTATATATATAITTKVVPVKVVAVNGVPIATKQAVAKELPQHSELVQREIDTAARALLKDTGLTGRELFRCAEADCTATAGDQKAFNVHMMQHGLASQADYRCWHCNVRSKNILALVQHIVGHSRHRFFCIFCDHTGAKNADMVRHMRDTHNRFGLMNLYLNQTAGRSSICSINSGEHNDDQPMVTCPRGMQSASAMHSFGLRMLSRYRHREAQRNKRHFGPDEVDQLPQSAILFSPIFCQLCGFNSKVRTNMVRHLQSCKNEQQQQQQQLQKQHLPPQQQLVDPVNPVPCLDRGELHFDRMRNLACSSNDYGGTIARDVATAETACLAAAAEREVSTYVPETNRFVCNAVGCHYMSQTEDMLKNHLITLHSNEPNYKCPHCNTNLGSGNVERIVAHLQLHDSCVYKCTKCPFHKSSRALVSAHVANAHTDAISLRLERSGNATTVCTVATTLAEAASLRRSSGSSSSLASDAAAAAANAAGASSTSSSSSSSVAGGGGGSGVVDGPTFAVPAKLVFRWLCSLCSESFANRQLVMQHATSVHSIMYQYQCTICMMQNNYKNVMLEHMTAKHPGSGPQAIKTFYTRSGSVASEQNTPIWRRDDPNKVKNIRGILIDYEEMLPTATTKTLSPSMQLSTRDVVPHKTYRRIAPVVDHNQDPNDDVQIIDTVETLLVIESDDEESDEITSSPSQVVLSVNKTEQSDAIVIENSASTTSPIRLQESVRKIEPEFIYNCKHCSRRAQSVVLLHAHWQDAHKFKPRDSDQLNVDEPFIFHVDENLRCLRCTNDIRIPKRSHRSHAARFHAGLPIIMTELANPNNCGLCSFVATTMESMREHAQQKHPAPKQIDQTLLNRPLVMLSSRSLQMLQQVGFEQHKCLYCEEVFNCKTDFELHHANKHTPMPHLREVLAAQPRFACTICDQLADTEQEVVQHLQHHNMYKFHKKYKCVHCPAAFGKKGAVRVHCQQSHGIDTNEWQLTPLQGRLAVYRRIKILFPNGLMVCKAEVASTRWGDMTEITRVINAIEEQELAEQRTISMTVDTTVNSTRPDEELVIQSGKRKLAEDNGAEIAESEAVSKCARLMVEERPQVARRSRAFDDQQP